MVEITFVLSPQLQLKISNISQLVLEIILMKVVCLSISTYSEYYPGQAVIYWTQTALASCKHYRTESMCWLASKAIIRNGCNQCPYYMYSKYPTQNAFLCQSITPQEIILQSNFSQTSIRSSENILGFYKNLKTGTLIFSFLASIVPNTV